MKKRLLPLLLCFFTLPANYFYSDFSSGTLNDWVVDHRYSQSGWYTNEALLVEDSVIQLDTSAGGHIEIAGSPHNQAGGSLSQWEYNGTWMGNGLYLTNLYSASENRPFGFELERDYAHFAFNGYSGEDRYQAEFGVWLIQNESLIAEWQKYQNMFMVFDNAQTTSGDRSRFGYYQGIPQIIDLSAVENARGESIDISDGYGGSESINSEYAVDGSLDNSNPVRIRITHDGTTIRTYINPDPDDSDPNLPNEYCLVVEREVSWKDDMFIYLNHATRGRNYDDLEAHYDYLQIREIAQNASGYIQRQGSEKSLFFKVEMNKEDAGFNTLVLDQSTVSDTQNMAFYREGELIYKGRDIYSFEKNKKLFLVLNEMQDQKAASYELRLGAAGSDSPASLYLDAVQYDHMPSTWNRSATTGAMKVDLETSQSEVYVYSRNHK